MANIRRQQALDYHEQGRPGKLEVVPTKPTNTQHDLSLAYSPGVAEPSRAIAANPDDVYRYTARGNLVAVVSNGTAVLGLGDVGPAAAKPVMEGKAVLFKRFADIDVFDLEIKAESAEDVIRFCEMLEPTVGGINLEDISAPDSFEIEAVLTQRLDIPVFHDDQHGTAIITGAALVNALDVVGKNIEKVKVTFSGAGGAAIATAHHYVRLGVRIENILMVDSRGVIRRDRAGGLSDAKAVFARDTAAENLEDAMRDADVFVGLSVGGVVSKQMVASMAENPIVFAMANPDPEILPEDVKAVRPDAIVATGRADYPNQVNNVLGFPFIFRGALDVRARTINDEMKMAATRALAALAREDVPEAVATAYGGRHLHFGPEYLIPTPFDSRVLLNVAPAVARAAMESGVARREIDLEAYRAELEGRLGPARELLRGLRDRARLSPRRIIFPEGENERVIRAAHTIHEEGFGVPVLLGDARKIWEFAAREDIDLAGIEVEDPRESGRRADYAERYFERRKRKGVTREVARTLLRDPAYFAAMMVECGDADTLIAGADTAYPDALRPALRCIGTLPGIRRVSGLTMLAFEHSLYFFADTTVNIDPDARDLAEIAILAGDFACSLGIQPRIAMLSFSNFGSAKHPESLMVREATLRVQELRPDLLVDGEMQADTAVVERILKHRFEFSVLQQSANVLIFPNLSAANASYQLLSRLGGASAIGPVLLGMRRPVHVLQRGASVDEITNLAAISVVDSAERDRQEADGSEAAC